MSYRGTGGTGAGDDARSPVDVADDGITDADLDELRRTSPRRAARIEARRAELAREGAARGPVAGTVAGDEVFDQHAEEHGPHDVGPVDAPVEHHGVVEHHPVAEHAVGWDDGHHDGAHDDGAHLGTGHYDGTNHYDVANHYDDTSHYDEHHDGEHHDGAHHDAFGDPVADGYVAPEGWVAPAPRRRRRGAGLLALVVVVAIVGTAGWFAYQGLRPVIGDIQAFDLFSAPEDYEGAGQGSVEVVVAPGDRGPQMGRTLADADVVASVEAFISAANAEPRFTSVQPGTYTLAQQMSAAEAVQALLDPANRVTETVVIAEGLRVDQILDRLAEGTGLPREDLEAALAEAELPAAAGEADGAIVPAEGFLYPDGYQFGDDPTAAGVIDAMIARGQEVLTDLGVAPEDQLEVLTKASLVQGEARIDEDFGKVAQVIENRLAIDQPLELDSTVNYATQTFDTRTTAEQRESDSPYNTYRFPGLPPGPIKSPGRQAIEAVANPTAGPWLYFVTVDLCTGETAFAESFDEHRANVAQLNAWQRENTNDDGSLNCG